MTFVIDNGLVFKRPNSLKQLSHLTSLAGGESHDWKILIIQIWSDNFRKFDIFNLKSTTVFKMFGRWVRKIHAVLGRCRWKDVCHNASV
jgi:hypothetical protein